ncbi:MAG: histidine phosphatase family protein [Nitrososphaerales archaeon]|nr:histidine phosphatase family protein [Nitrososphaerales archaeon]
MGNAIRITYFVHSTSVFNERKRLAGWYNTKLSDLGRKQALELGKLIANKKFDVVFCSDLDRALDTARTAFGGRFAIKMDKRLRECNYGDYAGSPISTVDDAKDPWFLDTPFPHGESYRDVEIRVKEFLKDLEKEWAGKRVAIVAHQAPQLVLEVLLNKKTWEEAIKTDWRHRGHKGWRPGWTYSLKLEA